MVNDKLFFKIGKNEVRGLLRVYEPVFDAALSYL